MGLAWEYACPVVGLSSSAVPNYSQLKYPILSLVKQSYGEFEALRTYQKGDMMHSSTVQALMA